MPVQCSFIVKDTSIVRNQKDILHYNIFKFLLTVNLPESLLMLILFQHKPNNKVADKKIL